MSKSNKVYAPLLPRDCVLATPRIHGDIFLLDGYSPPRIEYTSRVSRWTTTVANPAGLHAVQF